MLERLSLVRLAPQTIVDVGCGRGEGLVALKRHYPQARLVGVDASIAVVHAAQQSLAPPSRGFFARMRRKESDPIAALVAGDAHALPLANASVDLVWSNLALHWFVSPQRAIEEWYRVMRPGALLNFSFFGVDTLAELRAIGARTMSFHDMHDIGDALLAAGFSEPVMDTQRLTLTWRTPQSLLDDVRALGGNALRGRFRGLLGRRSREEWLRTIETMRDEEGLIRCSAELVFGHAWCPERKRRSDGLASIEFHPRRRDVDDR